MAGGCVIAACTAGYADCDLKAASGCEVAIANDPKNCGACGTVCDPINTPSCIDSKCAKIECVRIGWKFGQDSWDCPQGYKLPTVNDYNFVKSCITPQDQAMFSYYHDIGVAVGGCNCKWNGAWCGAPSIETINGGRMCGDFNQLQICISQ
jgi:hypothetical protein